MITVALASAVPLMVGLPVLITPLFPPTSTGAAGVVGLVVSTVTLNTGLASLTLPVVSVAVTVMA
jgi:hypothetical protein